ncbi:MAG: AI-2E family transporter [Armatimonadota bacterium]|nr:AI-2E family transporter [Armatimonadota bacterium]
MNNMLGNNSDHIVAIVWRLAVRLALLAAVIVLAVSHGPRILARLSSIFVSVIASIVLVYALMPSVDWLCRRGFVSLRMKPRNRRLLATIVVFVGFLGLVALCVYLFINPIQQELSDFSEKVGDYAGQLGELFRSVAQWYRTEVPESIKVLVGKLDYSKLTTGITNSIQRILKLLTSSVEYALELVLIPVLAFYFLLDYKSLTHELYALVPPQKRRRAMQIGHSVGEILESYVFGQLILCAIAGVLTGVVLALLRMPYVVVLALFAAITRAIPIIGPVLSGVPIILVGLIYSGGSLALPIYLLCFVCVMHFVESKFILPKLMEHRLHLHPATIIIVLLIGAEFLGVIGMFLAAPVAAIIRELLRWYYVRPRST